MMIDEQALININVTICDRPYRLKVKPDEEENVRKAAKYVAERVKEYQEHYAGKDKQDYLAMCALLLATEKMNQVNPIITSDSEIMQELEQLDIQLQKALKL